MALASDVMVWISGTALIQGPPTGAPATTLTSVPNPTYGLDLDASSAYFADAMLGISSVPLRGGDS